MYKCLQYIKVNGRFIDKGENVDLSNLSAQEIARLEKKGIVVKVNEKLNIEQESVRGSKKVNDGSSEDDGGNDDNDEMTAEEVKAELMEKITHAVAVKELKLLEADFKANASLESLVELIMEEEEYENHFLDYIENNEL